MRGWCVVLVGVLWGVGACASTPGMTAAAVAPRGVRLRSTIDRYPISGRTMEEVTRSLRAAQEAGGGFAAHYYSEWRASYGLTEGGRGSGCRVVGINLELQSRIRVPEWRLAAEAPPELRAAWEQYTLALDNHEREHERIALRLAGDIVRRLEQLRNMSCQQLRVDADRELQALRAQFVERQARFDQETQHGATTGVRWPPPRPPAPTY